MTLPVLEKTWQFSINNYSAPARTVVEQNKPAMLAIKNSLIGFALHPWVVWGSCDGAGGAGSFGNGDAVDRWVDTGDLIWAAAASNHSWIVLTQHGLGSANASICIDLSNANTYQCSLVLSPSAGFGVANGGGDGTATARPTATDEVVLISNTNWGVTNTVGTRQVIHGMQSTDGECTRILVCSNGAVIGFWMLDVPANAIAAWTPLVLGNASGSTSAVQLTRAIQSSITTPVGKAKIGAATVSMTMVYETYYGVTSTIPFQWVPDDQSSEYTFFGLGVYCTTAGHRGKKARLVDIWFNMNNATDYGTGQPFPDDGSYQFVNIGQFIFPWNGTAKVALA
jgi:hypothetical protein